jgi:N-acetylmuramic acid 6-phosphate (MurNAc-6-P) etherase
LDLAGGDVKVAIVMLLTGVDATEAGGRLDAHGGVVRAAIEEER